MENTIQNPQTNSIIPSLVDKQHDLSKTSRYRIVFFLITLSTIFLGLGIYLYNRNSNGNITTVDDISSSDLTGLAVVYGYSTYSPTTTLHSDPKKYIADLNNKKRVEVNPETFANYFSPTGTRFARVASKSFATSVNSDPNVFKTIVDLSNRNDVLDIGFPRWSPDENKLAYEIRINRYGGEDNRGKRKIYSEAQYWVINFDGSDNKMVGNLVNYPGGGFIGYDFNTGIVYASMNNFEPEEYQSVVALSTLTNQSEEIVRFPIDTRYTFSSNFNNLYYLDGNKIMDRGINTKQTRVVFDISSVDIEVPLQSISFILSPNNKLLLITLFEAGGSKSHKYILNLETNSLDKTLSDGKYELLSFNQNATFSPDSNYLVLTAHGKGRYCFFDLTTKNIIPFYNCELVNGKYINTDILEDIGINGWISNIENITIQNIPMPTPTSTPTPRSMSQYGDSATLQARNIVRKADIDALINAIIVYKKDNGALPSEIMTELQNISKKGADICSDLTPNYIGALPRDPNQKFDPDNPYASGGYVVSCGEAYDTGYTIVKGSNNQVTITAPLTEQIPILSITK